MKKKRQAVVTAIFGDFAEKLDRTFLSFAQNPFLELHAFVIGNCLPKRRLTGMTYHLRQSDPAFGNTMREAYYRRWSFIDELQMEFALVVDNNDVLCLQSLPEIPALLRGATVGACVEHLGGRYILGQQYTSSYLNAGVTLWNVPESRKMRLEIIARGRSYFRKLDDQHSFNEIVQTRYFDQMIILPSQYNYRACLAPKKIRRWPTV